MNSKARNNTIFVFNLINVLVLIALFCVVMLTYYRDINNYYFFGFVLMVGLYLFLLLTFCNIFGAFDIGNSRTNEISFSYFLGCLFPNVVIFLVWFLMSKFLPAVWPMLLLLFGQTFIMSAMVFLEKQHIRKSFPPLKALLVHGKNYTAVRDKLLKYQHYNFNLSNTADYKAFEKTDIKVYECLLLVDLDDAQRRKAVKKAYENNLPCYVVPSISDLLFTSSKLLHLIDTPIVLTNTFGPNKAESIIKRLIDIIGSLVLLVIASPFMLLTFIAIKIQDGGPALYRQTRLTKDGKTFEMVKFRSMIVNAESDGKAVFTKEGDSRITPVGKFIRATRIDELPQLFNILKGDMSFVGPRPERPEIVANIIKDIPEFNYRLKVKAGLTGYAQLYGKYNTSLKDKLLLDLYYIENYSLLLDIQMLILTVKIIFKKESTEGY